MTYQYNNNINNNKNTNMYVRHTVVLVIDVLWYCNSIGFERAVLNGIKQSGEYAPVVIGSLHKWHKEI